MTFDISTAVEAPQDKISTTKFDINSMQEVNPTPVKSTPSISGFLRSIFGTSILEQYDTKLAEKEFLNKNPKATKEQFAAMVNNREQDIINQGVMRQLEAPMQLAVGSGAISAPLETVKALTAFSIKDHFFNARRWIDENKPNTPLLIKDLAEGLDLVVSGVAIGKMTFAKDFINKRMEDINAPKSVEIPPEQVAIIKDNPIVTETLGIKQDHIDASVNSNTPIQIPMEKVVDLVTKPEWETSKQDFGILLQEIKPVEETAKIKTRGLALGVQEKAIEQKLIQGFGDLPEYQTVNMKDQAQKASDLINKDYELAKKIAMGEEQAPKGVIPESLFVAVENKAIKEGDVNTLRDLATASRLSTEATTMGQRIRTLGERNPDSPVGAIKSIQEVRSKKIGKKIESQKIQIVKEIKDHIKQARPKKEDWSSFVKSLEC